MGDVDLDPAFIQATEHWSKPGLIEAEGIPVIDLSVFNSSDSTAVAKLVTEIGDACKNWGFFQVINHGVPLSCREALDYVSKEFFKLPLEEKRKVKRDEKSPLGYYDGEYTKNVRDWKEVFDFVGEEPTMVTASPDPDNKEVSLLFNKWPGSSQFQVWSNDMYESAEHRAAVNSEKERFSVPFIFNPSHTTIMEPLEDIVNEQNPAKYRAFNLGKFLSQRSISNLKKLASKSTTSRLVTSKIFIHFLAKTDVE